MNRIILDKKLFNLLPASAGLIRGLKKLQTYDFVFESDNYSETINSVLNEVLSLEDLKISAVSGLSFERDFTLVVKDEIIFIDNKIKADTFSDAVRHIIKNFRTASVKRKTKETDVDVFVSLDGTGTSSITTGIGFFDHMLEQIARHANIEMNIKVNGDLHVDEHHTVEDTGLALGEALLKALGTKKAIKRYGFFLPMDDAAAKCAVDLGGRGYLNFKCKFNRETVGGFPVELTEEFFKSIAAGLKANIYLRAKAKNDHHKIEAMFKAFAKSLNEACRIDQRSSGMLPSTKGTL